MKTKISKKFKRIQTLAVTLTLSFTGIPVSPVWAGDSMAVTEKRVDSIQTKSVTSTVNTATLKAPAPAGKAGLADSLLAPGPLSVVTKAPANLRAPARNTTLFTGNYNISQIASAAGLSSRDFWSGTAAASPPYSDGLSYAISHVTTISDFANIASNINSNKLKYKIVVEGTAAAGGSSAPDRAGITINGTGLGYVTAMPTIHQITFKMVYNPTVLATVLANLNSKYGTDATVDIAAFGSGPNRIEVTKVLNRRSDVKYLYNSDFSRTLGFANPDDNGKITFFNSSHNIVRGRVIWSGNTYCTTGYTSCVAPANRRGTFHLLEGGVGKRYYDLWFLPATASFANLTTAGTLLSHMWLPFPAV